MVLPEAGCVADAWVVAAVHRLPERPVRDGEHEANDHENEDHDESHPSESDQRCEDAAWEVNPAPCEVSPDRLRSTYQIRRQVMATENTWTYRGNGGADEPEYK